MKPYRVNVLKKHYIINNYALPIMPHKLDPPSYHALKNSIWKDAHHMPTTWFNDSIGKKLTVA